MDGPDDDLGRKGEMDKEMESIKRDPVVVLKAGAVFGEISLLNILRARRTGIVARTTSNRWSRPICPRGAKKRFGTFFAN